MPKYHLNIALTFLVVCLLITGCSPSVTFTQPQPSGINDIVDFPGRLQGAYLASDEVSVLTITDNMITSTEDVDIRLRKDSLPIGYTLHGDILEDSATGTKEKVTISGDSVFARSHLVDTMFLISGNNVLKKFKGRFFLNTKQKDSAWTVKILWLHRGTLSISAIEGQDDMDKLNEITESSSDTTSDNVEISRKQFKKFLKHRDFSNAETYKRIRRK